MDTILKGNVSVYGRAERLLVGIVLVSSVMFYGSVVPPWVSLLAVYPLITSIMAWDPIFAVVLKARSLFGPLDHGRKSPMAS